MKVIFIPYVTVYLQNSEHQCFPENRKSDNQSNQITPPFSEKGLTITMNNF